MSLRDAMRKAAGLLVEIPPDEAAPRGDGLTDDDLPDLDLPPEARLPSAAGGIRSVEQIVRETDGPNLDQISVDEKQVAAGGGLTSGGQVDFPAVYRAAGVPTATFTAEQMLETLASLPPELPLETKRITLKAMLGTIGKNMGATPETVVADASRKLAALDSYTHFMDRKVNEVTAGAEKEIAELEAQIATRRQKIESSKLEIAKIHQACESEADRLDDILEFFSLDVGPSKLAGGAVPGQPVTH